MDLREVGYDDRDWINLAQDRDHWRAYLDKRILAVVCNGTKAASTQFNIPIAYACNLGRILKESSIKGNAAMQRRRIAHHALEDNKNVKEYEEITKTGRDEAEVMNRQRSGVHFLKEHAQCSATTEGSELWKLERKINCPKTDLNLTSDTKKTPLMRKLGQKIIGAMLKGRTDAKEPVALDRPRKKLSFREPEIMGYKPTAKRLPTTAVVTEEPANCLSDSFEDLDLESLMLAGSKFQSLGMAIVKEDEYEEVRWDGIVSVVS
ncbi:hypothetical protein ANN_16531 [Periplaneta americana]|uniref:Uncharacterized protein n=1 Tax=Periplaneta americana TaxID=6978 RepID=A0ABQ8SST7_PERAM|nr:hypothetical protein ANN_16531 [Periplaneta americana]